MTYDYQRSVRLARRLIERFGREVTVVKYSRAPNDPNKPWDGPGEYGLETTVSTVAAFVDPVGSDELGFKMFDSETLRSLEQICLIAAGSEDLIDFDLVRDGGTPWRIHKAQAFKPGDTTILYFLGVVR